MRWRKERFVRCVAGHDGDGEKKERRLRWEPGLDHARRPGLGKGADFISRAKGSCWRVLAKPGKARFLFHSSCRGRIAAG